MNTKSKPVHPNKTELATLGGGCFWCLEAIFDEIIGVINVESGYVGGELEFPTYEQVSNGTTGHAEVVQVTFNPNIISFREILEIFFTFHNPTTLNQQGVDRGTQYRSVIFYHNSNQKLIAEKIIVEFDKSKIWYQPIVTSVEPFKVFYKAEKYHNRYFKRNPESGYCRVVISPKIAKLRKKYYKILKRK
ncbi:peptide-methionine (S)-S-oxide reductase MsrA [Candidatus Bathyarchaeota archaeon]|nr:peptide-methionine (S)-S-oxide reductase MsrA [Candidatus Bathyarchaeota archaeon]